MQKFWLATGVAFTVYLVMNGAAWYFVAVSAAIDAMSLVDAIKKEQ